MIKTLTSLFLYSTAMFTLPFVTFFGTQRIMKNNFHVLDRFTTQCVSVAAAVITVQLIIFCYVYKAFREPDDASDTNAITNEKDSVQKYD